jgi:HlyD family secretion protein
MATETSAPLGAMTWDDSEHSKPPRRRWRFPTKLVLLLACGILAVVGVAYALSGDKSAGVNKREMVDKVIRGDMVVSVTEDGNVESSSNVDVKCEVAGGSTILWLVKDGMRVEEGDELVRLDSSSIEDQTNQQKITYAKAEAAKIEAEKSFSAAKIGVQEYLEGTYVQQIQDAEAKITVAMENLRSSENSLQHTERMARKGYVTGLQREAQAFAVERAKLDLGSARTAKDVLEKFTKGKMMVDLESKRDTAEAKMRSEEAAFQLEAARLKRLQTQLEKCTIRAPHAGMVVFANEQGGRGGQQAVTIEEGAGVRERQSIIRLPDLAHMQTKVTVHESKVDLLRVGMRARVRIQDREFQGQVSSVANQPEASGWIASAVKKYATIVRIDGEPDGLRPGMTAVVEILVANLPKVLSVPVEAVVEQGTKNACWVRAGGRFERRPVILGLSSKTHVEIKDGLNEGEEVVLNPRAVIAEAREELRTEETVDVKQKFGDAKPVTSGEGTVGDAGGGRSRRGGGGSGGGGGGGGPGGRPQMSFSDLDKDSDGKITVDEAPERMKGNFDMIDTNSDGSIDAKEFATFRAEMKKRFGGAGGGAPGGGP